MSGFRDRLALRRETRKPLSAENMFHGIPPWIKEVVWSREDEKFRVGSQLVSIFKRIAWRSVQGVRRRMGDGE